MPNTIAKQLTRELKAHPVKAAMLGTLAVVALWFWAPLAIGFVAGDDEGAETSPPNTPSTASHAPAGSHALAATQPVPAPARTPWSKLVDFMEHDPLKQPLAQIDYSRDPFGLPVSSEDIATTDDGSTAPLPNQPAARGDGVSRGTINNENPKPPVASMTLMGTAIGPNKRSAVIDGRAIQEGEFVQMSDGERCLVVQITARKVTLRSGSKTWVLTQEDEDTADPPSGMAIIRRSAG